MVWNLFIVFFICLSFCVNKVLGQTEKPIFQFGVIADIQYGDCKSEGSRFYRNSLEKAEEAVNFFNDQKVQFTINLGDVIDRKFADFDSILNCLNQLKRKSYYLTGNHDYKDVKDNKVLYEKLNMPSEYYTFKKKNWVFVFLNTNEIAAYSNIVGTEKEQELTTMQEQIKATGGKQGARWNGGVSAKQLEWLDQLLAKSEKAGNNVILCSHHPFYPKSAFTALNNMEILDVIEKYPCVKAIFCGHHHAGGFGYFKNIPVITLEGMIETKDKNAFGIVKVYKDSIVIEGKGRMTSRVLKM